MGCCTNSGGKTVDQGMASRPIAKKSAGELTLHGDYFSSEVRTIVASLQFCGV